MKSGIGAWEQCGNWLSRVTYDIYKSTLGSTSNLKGPFQYNISYLWKDKLIDVGDLACEVWDDGWQAIVGWEVIVQQQG